MLYLRKILRCGRNHHVALPARWCRGHEVQAWSRVDFCLSLSGRPTRLAARAVACGRGLHATLPRAWRLAEGLMWGDPVLLLEGDPGTLEMQALAGCSEKDLARRGEVLAQLRIAAARAEGARAREASYREGYFRRASEDLFRPPSPPRGLPPRGRRGRG